VADLVSDDAARKGGGMKNFALIGAAGYIAPRHMAAIKATGNRLVAALDPSDSVGVIDSYFPDSAFFTEFERFDRHVDKLRRSGAGSQVDYVSICSPNYLHDSHVRFALRSDANVICEKPLVLNPWNIEGLIEAERAAGRKVSTILQLRVHPAIVALREKVRAETGRKHDIDLSYITGRGRWYLYSWKGDEKKSGGIATNIGIHLFDMLHFIFGDLQENRVHLSEPTRAAGYLEYERARVRWFLSVEETDLPATARTAGQRTFRSITVDGEEIDFSSGFADLHTRSYELILDGKGFSLDENRCAIETVAAIRTAKPAPAGERHPLTRVV
jgi:UDP-N-acetyl-2-amino-2-deoxyglucuronate dehydrogenase